MLTRACRVGGGRRTRVIGLEIEAADELNIPLTQQRARNGEKTTGGAVPARTAANDPGEGGKASGGAGSKEKRRKGATAEIQKRSSPRILPLTPPSTDQAWTEVVKKGAAKKKAAKGDSREVTPSGATKAAPNNKQRVGKAAPSGGPKKSGPQLKRKELQKQQPSKEGKRRKISTPRTGGCRDSSGVWRSYPGPADG